MNIIFFLSVLLKGVGAILEILLQIFLIRQIGMEGYGIYTTWISWADLLFWISFSGLVKCNTFYLSSKGVSIKNFKKKYYTYFVFPVLLLIGIVAVRKDYNYSFVLLITFLELLVLDKSSTLIARGKQMHSLIGEYVLGRSILLVGAVAFNATNGLSLYKLVGLYVVQYLIILCMFQMASSKSEKIENDISGQVSIRKLFLYQRADIVQSMIGQMPVIIQYLFAGAYEAGVVSIVLLIKKFINFITGPTAKIFLPEFSRLYKQGQIKELCEKFAVIMRIQMLFVGPLAVVLAGYPRVVLKIWDSELLKYAHLFTLCSLIFILGATLGPCGGVLQMSGKEKSDNFYREFALVLMFVTMFLFRKDRLFVLYGLCVQTMVESVGKYICVCKFLNCTPVAWKEYLGWWGIPLILLVITYAIGLQESVIAMILCAGSAFLAGVVRELRKNDEKIYKYFIRK